MNISVDDAIRSSSSSLAAGISLQSRCGSRSTAAVRGHWSQRRRPVHSTSLPSASVPTPTGRCDWICRPRTRQFRGGPTAPARVLVPRVEAQVLRDSQATRSAIGDAMHWLEAQVRTRRPGYGVHGGPRLQRRCRPVLLRATTDPAAARVLGPGRSFSDALARLRGRPFTVPRRALCRSGDACKDGAALGADGATDQRPGCPGEFGRRRFAASWASRESLRVARVGATARSPLLVRASVARLVCRRLRRSRRGV